MNEDRTVINAYLNDAFERGTVTKASNEKLQQWLIQLSTGQVVNETVRHREIIRGITINHIILQRHIDKLNNRNTVLQWIVIILASISIITGTFQIYTGLKYSKDIPPHLTQQAVPKSGGAKSKLFQGETPKGDQKNTTGDQTKNDAKSLEKQ